MIKEYQRETNVFDKTQTEAQKEYPGNFEVLSPYDFLKDFEEKAGKAKDRVWVQTMVLARGNVGARIKNTLMNTAQKGIDTKFHLDYHTPLIFEESLTAYLNPDKHLSPTRMLSEMDKKGVQITYTNPPRNILDIINPLNAFMGRSHIKINIVDNIAWVGGVNLTDHDFEREDFVVRITDPKIVNDLAKVFNKINENKPEIDYEIKSTDETSIIVDTGAAGRSKIWRKAVRLIRGAKERIIKDGYFYPDGEIASAMSQAYKQGIQVELVTSDIDKSKSNSSDTPMLLISKANKALLRLKGELLPTYEYPNLVHAKFLIVDNTVIFGSHNLTKSGVNAGTAEIAIQSTNPTLLKNLLAYHEKLKLKSHLVK